MLSKKQSVGFGYGAMCESLEKQANEQGYTLGKNAEKYEECKESIITLMLADVLTDSQVDKAIQKLNKFVVKSLKPLKSKEE